MIKFIGGFLIGVFLVIFPPSFHPVFIRGRAIPTPVVPTPDIILLERTVLQPSFWGTIEVFCDRRRGNLIYFMDTPEHGGPTVVSGGCEKKP